MGALQTTAAKLELIDDPRTRIGALEFNYDWYREAPEAIAKFLGEIRFLPLDVDMPKHHFGNNIVTLTGISRHFSRIPVGGVAFTHGTRIVRNEDEIMFTKDLDWPIYPE